MTFFPGTLDSETITGSESDDNIQGRGGNDTLFGMGGADDISAFDGADYLDGGDGNDRLEDSDGIDELWGGYGDDVFDVVVSTTGITVPVGSLDAGRGEDVINITGGGGYRVTTGEGVDIVTVRAGSGATSIDLGGAGDFVDVHRLTGDLTLALGFGADRVSIKSDFGTAGQGVIRVTDLEHLYGRYDLIEFASYLTAITGGAWNGSMNPFATGFAQLKQVWGGTEIWFNPTGQPGSGSVLGVFLEGVIASNLTTFNFGGYDPGEGLSKPREVVASMQNVAGNTITTNNDGSIENVRSYMYYTQNSGGFDSFVNAGTIRMGEDGTDGGPGKMAGIYVVFPGNDANSVFHNTATGTFIVESQTAPIYDVFPDETFGLYMPSSGDVDFRNDGLFEVRAARSYAIGIEAYGSLTFVNSGTFRVVGAESAIGLSHVSSREITNTGLIEVLGGIDATGIEFQGLTPDGFVNAGTIRAVTGPNSPYASFGLFIWQNGNLGAPTLLRNSGTIEADIAIYVNFEFGYGTNYNSAERLENSGTIRGDVYLSYGADEVINTGLMTGNTLLEFGDDFYDGRSGRHDGVIHGGGGNDRILGGAHDDTIDDGRGNDMVIAGGGDDLIYSSGGNDALDGGAGNDTLSFIGAWQAVTVDLASESAVYRGNIRVRAFEAVVGSGFADTLRGSAVAELLEGAAGDDVLDGRGGDDVLIGDSGADTLTGGAGNDRFIFSRGDGADRVMDFQAGDKIEIHGYDAYLSLEQVGSAVRINLSATDSILISNATAATLTATNLLFHHDELEPEPEPIPTDFLRIDESALVIGAGTTLNLTRTEFLEDHYANEIRQAAIWSETISSTGTLWNAGTIRVEADASMAPLAGIIFSDPVYSSGGYGTLNATFYNLAGGVFEVIGHGGDARGASGTVRNAGTLRAFSDGGDAMGVHSSNEMVQNWGSIVAQASGAATGLFQINAGFYNIGSITANGGDKSVGVDARFNIHPTAAPGTSVNAGTITVTDGTSWMDSVALQFDVMGIASFWNTGTVKADFAINGATRLGSTFTIYNSGTLDGIVRTGGGVDQLYNSGLITGSVDLLSSDDLYDGRLGRVMGSVSGGDGNDRIYGGVHADVLNGGMGDDFLFGGGGNDKLTGGQGRDTFHIQTGGGQDEIVDFQAGVSGDVISVSGYANYTSLAQQGADVLVTFSANDSILLRNVQATAILPVNFLFSALALGASPLAAPPAAPNVPTPPVDTFAAPFQYYGTAADDELIGGIGADEFYGGAGADRMYGKGGNDLYYVDRAADVIFESAGEGIDTVVSTAGFYLYANVENLTLAAGAGDIFGVGNELANTILGNEGSNLLIAGAGDDILRGGSGVDSLFGQDGADQLFGDAGVDYLVGGIGNDTLDGGTDADALYGEDGDDTLIGGSDFKTDILVGGAGNDVLRGDSGQADYDLMDGGSGNDSYYVDTGDDLTFEGVGGGTDTVYANVGGANNGVYLYANVENLVLLNTTKFGVGNDLNNIMTGSASGNWLLGGAGNDTLNGKAGGDVLFGEGGADTFVFEVGTGGDVIGDFLAGTDKIDLRAFGITSYQTVLNSMHENGGTTAIDLGNGDLIVLNGVASATLQAGDFILAPAKPAPGLGEDVDDAGPALLDHATVKLWHGGESIASDDLLNHSHWTPGTMFDTPDTWLFV